MALWPNNLPPPLLAGFQERTNAKVLKTPMETGPQRVTRYSSHMTASGSFSFALDASQMATWRAMERDSNHFADWFEDLPLDIGDGSGVQPVRARITLSSFSVLVPGEWWKVTAQFETDDLS